jgi:hypothetical protein
MKMTRARGLAKWLVPGGILAFMPKCPACVVGYVALATGLGISVSAAASIRALIVFGCVVAIVYLMVDTLRAAGRRPLIWNSGRTRRR